ncbi:hypothetical protein U5A82_19460 [Sphingobium sp. CR2-8]|uniref:hypothetical protein n=1 Tax=Sphingobium sp. CR2-8 TaxID=1306534 RepID=UPI002DBC832C|nr:hypothetical protein [Sphingobium sp. CR2-8]MEC3912571.1 hypothetical protein [Sphingobium sp. CR2-8]
MTAHTKPRFPAISVDEAHLRQALPMALCGRVVDGATLIAAFPADPAGGGDWFHCDEAFAFRILRLDGRAVHMDATDGPAMADLLDRADPLLSAIESALGLTLVPSAMGARADPATLVARIDAGATARIELALAPNTPFLPTAAPLAPTLVSHIPLPVRMILDGPRLSPTDAAALAPGDLLLIGAAPLSASLIRPGAPPMRGRISPQDRQFRSDHRSSSQ